MLFPAKPPGKVNIHRRENSDNWQCSAFLNGFNGRVSTHVEPSFQPARVYAPWASRIAIAVVADLRLSFQSHREIHNLWGLLSDSLQDIVATFLGLF